MLNEGAYTASPWQTSGQIEFWAGQWLTMGLKGKRRQVTPFMVNDIRRRTEGHGRGHHASDIAMVGLSALLFLVKKLEQGAAYLLQGLSGIVSHGQYHNPGDCRRDGSGHGLAGKITGQLPFLNSSM